ncbi:DUF3008 family protein [Rhodobacteraceae bacterium]|nr:DUF3008 family protein [Paracoccaceae bacterium]
MELTKMPYARAAAAALSALRGVRKPEDLHGISRDMYDHMTPSELEEMVQTIPCQPTENVVPENQAGTRASQHL